MSDKITAESRALQGEEPGPEEEGIVLPCRGMDRVYFVCGEKTSGTTFNSRESLQHSRRNQQMKTIFIKDEVQTPWEKEPLQSRGATSKGMPSVPCKTEVLSVFNGQEGCLSPLIYG